MYDIGQEVMGVSYRKPAIRPVRSIRQNGLTTAVRRASTPDRHSGLRSREVSGQTLRSLHLGSTSAYR